MTENSKPRPFFSCGKMNLVILGISSIRTGLIPKDYILTMIQHSDPFVIISYFGIGGGLLEFGPFMAHSGEFQSNMWLGGFVHTCGHESASFRVFIRATCDLRRTVVWL